MRNTRFAQAILDEIRARLPVSHVVGRLEVVLKPAGRELKGRSPFTQERTPSFFVNDVKQRFFDFSSGKNGDIFQFLMLTEGISFPEAVRQLAAEAGVALQLSEGMWDSGCITTRSVERHLLGMPLPADLEDGFEKLGREGRIGGALALNC